LYVLEKQIGMTDVKVNSEFMWFMVGAYMNAVMRIRVP